MFSQFANPAKFQRLCEKLVPFLLVAALLGLSVGLYQVFFVSPDDYQQGSAVKMMYIHVPAAWLALMGYSAMAGASVCYLIWKHAVADVVARAIAPVGAVFTLMTLITGSIWGKPMWGAWWVWDARLTSMLILLFLYIGYIAYTQVDVVDDKNRKSAAILALVGFINVPIIKFSVEWWNTLHQPASIIRLGGPTIDPSMLWPLLIMAGGFTALFWALVLVRAQTLLLTFKLRRLILSKM